jgi:hypothetical protein
MDEATMEKPHTFGEGAQYLNEGHGIDYEVAIPAPDGEGRKYTSHGALMTRDAWVEAVEEAERR